jgi:hypothetical protein
MAPWPYPNISPAQFESLTADERIVLEAMSLAFIEKSTQVRRNPKPRARKAG